MYVCMGSNIMYVYMYVCISYSYSQFRWSNILREKAIGTLIKRSYYTWALFGVKISEVPWWIDYSVPYVGPYTYLPT